MVRLITQERPGYKEHHLTITKPSPDEVDVKCPRCGSKKIVIDRKGYSFGDGAVGGICFGPLGLLCGGMDKDKLIGECLRCGKKFNVSRALKNQWVNNEEDSWECEHCGKEFVLDKKEENELKTKGKIKVTCPYCDKKITCEE